MIKEYFVNKKLNKEFGVGLIQANKNCIDKYRRYVRGNREDKDYVCLMKLNRNYILGKKIFESGEYIIKAYGNLRIKYNKEENMLVDMYNEKGLNRSFNINTEIKDKLNKIMKL